MERSCGLMKESQVAVGTDEVTNGREDWKIHGHPVYNVEAMYLPPLDGNDVTPRAVALLVPILRT